jgi:hypothetical protein
MVLLAVAAVAAAFALLSRRYATLYRWAGGVALAGHVALAFLVPLLPYSWDIALFHEVALGVLDGERTGPFSQLGAFGTFQAVVYAAFGADPRTLSVVNGLLAVVTPLPLCHLARRLYPSLESTDGLLLAALYVPLPFLFATLPMRDALSTLIAVTLLAAVVSAVADHDARSAVALPPLWGLLFLLRVELAALLLVAAAAAVGVAVVTRVADESVSLVSLWPLAAAVGAAGFVLFARLFPVAALNESLQYRAAGGAAYLDFMAYESWLDVLLAAPVRAIYFQFAPFPLHVDSVFDAFALVSLPLLVVLVTLSYRSLRTLDVDRVVAATLLVFYAGGVVGYGLMDANFGTTIRHRGVFVFVLCVFAAPVLEDWVRSVRGRLDGAGRQRGDDGEHQQKTEELDPGVEVRPEHRDDADEDDRTEYSGRDSAVSGQRDGGALGRGPPEHRQDAPGS